MPECFKMWVWWERTNDRISFVTFVELETAMNPLQPFSHFSNNLYLRTTSNQVVLFSDLVIGYLKKGRKDSWDMAESLSASQKMKLLARSIML